ncbi:TPA: restriction endonuclease subunit S [Serratia liquefaciens]|nr:restriction endonuclease subunit S [Serratia liquefaciens]
MAKYKAYPEYKESGVEWLGEVPNHWKTVSISRLFSRIKRTGYTEKELLSVYRDYGVIPKSSRDDNNNKPSEDLSPYQLVEPNDLVMNKMKAWQGSIAISEYEGIVSPAYFVYKPNSALFELAHPRYVHYLLRNPIYVTQYLSRSKGIRVNQWDLDPDEFRNIELLLPDKTEQEKIYSFLDHETAKIDNLIEKQHQLIELLKEKRQAVISHAVTKGLNPDVPMKDSGIEWLGEVPAHWKVSKLKYFASIQGGFAFSSDSFTHEGVQILRIGNLYQNNLELERQPIFLDVNEFDRFRDFAICKDDILMSLTGTLGKRDYGFAIKVERDDVFLLNQRVAKITPDETRLSRDFLLYILWSDSYLNQLYSLPSGTKQANLSNSNVTDILVACPAEISEQKSIIEMVTKQMEVFDSLMDNSLSLMESLQERRTALISAAVTGKIDVRDWVAPDTQDVEASEEAIA